MRTVCEQPGSSQVSGESADRLSADLTALRAWYAAALGEDTNALTGGIIRLGREQCGLSVRGAAAAVGVSKATWSTWETGRCQPGTGVRALLGWGDGEGVRLGAEERAAQAKRPRRPHAVREVKRGNEWQAFLPALLVDVDGRTVMVEPVDMVVANRLRGVRLAAGRARQGLATGTDRVLLAANGDTVILELALGSSLPWMREHGFDEATIRAVGATAYVWATSSLEAAQGHWGRLRRQRAADGPGTPRRPARGS